MSYKDFERRADNLDILARKRVTVALTSTDSEVYHGLGKVPRGYLCSGNDAGGVVYDGSSVSSTPNSHISLRSTVDGNYTLIIF